MRGATTYSKRYPGGLLLLFRLRGSTLPRALPFGILAGVYGALVEYYYLNDDIPTNGANSQLFIHTYPYHVLAFLTGFGLIFRLSFSMQRYWEARTMLQNAAAKWGDGAIQVLSFDAACEAEVARRSAAAFARFAAHTFSLLHAVAMHTLRRERSLESLGALSPDDLDASAASAEVSASAVRVSVRGSEPPGCVEALTQSPARRLERHYETHPLLVIGGVHAAELGALRATEERVHLVMGALHRALVSRRKAGGLTTDAPVVSRIYQVLSDGMLAYLAALKLRDTPFPLPYAQINAYFCLVNLAFFPLVVASKVVSVAMVAAISCVGVTMMYAVNEVARELEDPYVGSSTGFTANMLMLAEMQDQFNERLLASVPGGAAGARDLLAPSGADPEEEAQQYDAFVRAAHCREGSAK